MLEKLLYQARRGEQEALEEILTRFRPLVLATARRLRAEGIDWEDFIQEGYLALVEAVFSFNPRGRAGFPWYARRRVYYTLLNYRRREKRNRERQDLVLDIPLDGEGGVTLGDLLPARGAGTEEEVLARDQYSRLRLALARLPEKQRRALVGLYLEGKGVSELAGELGISPSSVKGLEARGLKNLARFFGQRGAKKEGGPEVYKVRPNGKGVRRWR